jgi:hypothetical protein
MAQADSNNSITAPVDTTRRRFLAVAAVGSIVGAGSLAAATQAPSLAVPAALQDPVLGLIEAHRKASVVHLASLREQERLEKADIWHCDAAEQACHEEFRIFDVLLAAAATTLPGILAKQACLQDIAEREPWMFDGRKGSALRLIEGFAASIANVWAVQS